MRFYTIDILNDDGSKFRSYSSLNPDGTVNFGALNIELDIPAFSYDAPKGNAHIKIWGIPLSDIAQSAQFKDKTIRVFGGMSKGLPLANPAQAGLLVEGSIFQPFGNWIGTEQSLEFVFYQFTGSSDNALNFTFNWKQGDKLSTAIDNTLRSAMPKLKRTIKISDRLVLGHDEPGVYQTLAQFADYVNEISRAILGGSYTGVHMTIQNGSVNVFDGTSEEKPLQIDFTDLIGQPTWQGVSQVQLNCVMRSDILVGDFIKLPQGQSTTTQASNPRFRNSLAFQGTFLVTDVRHVGNFKQPNAYSWITVIDCNSLDAI